MQAQKPERVIWCLGMYASASTWLFNVARQVLEAGQAEKVQVTFVSGKEQHLALGGAGVVNLVKSHEITSETRTLDLARLSGKILITIRDPRDAVASLMQAHKYDFSRALDHAERSARLCGSFAKDRRVKLFRYETSFFEVPDTVETIAQYLGCQLPDGHATSIYNSLSRAEVEKHIGQMSKIPGILRDAKTGDLLDTKTQWHSHHAGRSGEIGKWQEVLATKQADEVERRLDFYFERMQAL